MERARAVPQRRVAEAVAPRGEDLVRWAGRLARAGGERQGGGKYQLLLVLLNYDGDPGIIARRTRVMLRSRHDDTAP